MLNQVSTEKILEKLRSQSPLRQGIAPNKIYRYSPEFKKLVLSAVEQNISHGEIAKATGLRTSRVSVWKNANNNSSSAVRRLTVIDEATSRASGPFVIKIGDKVSLELNASDLTVELLAMLAEL